MKDFILQEFLNGSWLDLYNSNSLQMIKKFFSTFCNKYPYKKFRIIEVKNVAIS